MTVTYNIRVEGKFDSRQLYELVSMNGANVTDLGEFTLIYGEAEPLEAAEVVFYASLFGKTTAEIETRTAP